MASTGGRDEDEVLAGAASVVENWLWTVVPGKLRLRFPRDFWIRTRDMTVFRLTRNQTHPLQNDPLGKLP